MAIQSFRELIVWQKSMKLARDTYTLSRALPSEERFGLASQIQRSAISIPSNIAEGSKRSTAKDYVQFLRIANGSAAELETQLLLIRDIYSLEVQEELIQLDEVQRMLQALIKSLLQPKTYPL
ncbi:MAG: four helix bundle protein [Candidatus Pacebacteria bacterium]|nr:four helix bundle protein [Candidatus Paceibacterota bacterium]